MSSALRVAISLRSKISAWTQIPLQICATTRVSALAPFACDNRA